MAVLGRRFKSFNPRFLVFGHGYPTEPLKSGRVIITCPNCRTRYRVAADALSAAGRQVQCASCSELWYATPGFPPAPGADPEPSEDELAFRADADTLFTQADEDLLDAAFSRADPAPRPVEVPVPSQDHLAGEPAEPFLPEPREQARARTEALARRRRGMIAALPMARVRRIFRIATVLLLVAAAASAIVWRTDIVRAAPQLDGLYRLVGLGTNVVGLDFIDVNTLGTTRDGISVLIVTAKISNITNRVAFVPSVLVSLIGAGGQVMYEWTVTPSTREILPGDILDIDAQLTAPPQGVERVRLSFVDGQNRPQGQS